MYEVFITCAICDELSSSFDGIVLIGDKQYCVKCFCDSEQEDGDEDDE